MGYVYLIANDEWTEFKIGKTKSNDKKRISNLQTGNGSKLEMVKCYETDYYHKIEKWFHSKYKNKQLIGEWFSLSDDDIFNFKKDCIKAEETFKLMEDLKNPFI